VLSKHTGFELMLLLGLYYIGNNVYSKLQALFMIIFGIQSVLTVICCKLLLYLSNLGFRGMLLCAERNYKICVRNVSRIWAKELWSPYSRGTGVISGC